MFSIASVRSPSCTVLDGEVGGAGCSDAGPAELGGHSRDRHVQGSPRVSDVNFRRKRASGWGWEPRARRVRPGDPRPTLAGSAPLALLLDPGVFSRALCPLLSRLFPPFMSLLVL